jgi:hypothetical protein
MWASRHDLLEVAIINSKNSARTVSEDSSIIGGSGIVFGGPIKVKFDKPKGGETRMRVWKEREGEPHRIRG